MIGRCSDARALVSLSTVLEAPGAAATAGTFAPPLPSSSPPAVALRDDSALRRQIGAQLRLVRSLLGLTQDKIGRVLDVLSITISRWELEKKAPGRVGRARLRILLRHRE